MTKDLKPSLAWAGGLIGLALAATAARRLGYIDADAVTRIVMAAIGLMVAWLGNRAPKTFVASAHARQVNRVAGWSMALSGLVNAAFWAFGSMEQAMTLGTAAIVAGLAVTLIYCLRLRGQRAA
jgi:hypothetical protein